MNTTNAHVTNDLGRRSERKARRYRQAVARRRIQDLRDEKILQGWLTEVWDESPSVTQFDSGMHLH